MSLEDMESWLGADENDLATTPLLKTGLLMAESSKEKDNSHPKIKMSAVKDENFVVQYSEQSTSENIYPHYNHLQDLVIVNTYKRLPVFRSAVPCLCLAQTVICNHVQSPLVDIYGQKGFYSLRLNVGLIVIENVRTR